MATHIEILSISGDHICTVSVDPDCKGSDVKLAVQQATGISRFEHDLVFSNQVLPPREILKNACTESPARATLIRCSVEHSYDAMIEDMFDIMDHDRKGVVDAAYVLRTNLDTMLKSGANPELEAMEEDDLDRLIQSGVAAIKEEGNANVDGHMTLEMFNTFTRGTKPEDRSICDEIVVLEKELLAWLGQQSADEAKELRKL